MPQNFQEVPQPPLPPGHGGHQAAKEEPQPGKESRDQPVTVSRRVADTEELFAQLLLTHTPAEALAMVNNEPPVLLLTATLSREVLFTAPLEEQEGPVHIKNANGSTWKCVTRAEHADLISGKPVTILMWTPPHVVLRRVTHLPPRSG